MAKAKRYYWMKLKESFMTSDTIDYFMSQPDGANYVVLYQMLCLKTINTEGRLSRQIGEIIIPYDVEKIHRDCKWFSVDTIRVALKLYQAVGLIYVDVDGTLVLSDHQNLVGSETDAAVRMRNTRSRRNNLLPPAETDGEQGANIVTPEIDIRDRDKRLDIRDEEREVKADKPPKPTRHKYGQYSNVLLSDDDLDKLKSEFPMDWQARIERLSEYIASSGKSYRNHLATIRSWAKKDKENAPAQTGGNTFLDMLNERRGQA